MDNFNLCDALSEVLNKTGYKVTIGEIFSEIRGIAAAEIATKSGPPGPTGPAGMMGIPGPAGRDAWDKYSWDPSLETMMTCSWKGIEFQFPLMTVFVEGFPEGELTYGDINYIRTIYGNGVVERMATFWRREYDYHTDMQFFISEEDACRLQSINQSSSYPDPLKG